MTAPRLIVALDLPDAASALAAARRFDGLPLWLKVGLELFTAEGPEVVRTLRKNAPVFLDLKFHDIPTTVRGAVRSAGRLGAAMMTLHLDGGEEMIRAAVQGKQEAGAEGTLLMGITVLTSQGTETGTDPAAVVLERAQRAREWGLDGVVCSGHEAAAVKAACGKDFFCLCPGIRPAGAATDDQARVMTPRQAAQAGADFLVMGRPILRAEDPRAAAAAVLDSLRYTNTL